MMRSLLSGLPLWLELSLKEIWSSRRFSLSFVLNLSLGLMGFILLDAFKGSIHTHLDGRSKAILAADLQITSRRDYTQEELDTIAAALPPSTIKREEISLMSMAATPQASRLVEIRALGPGFPFYGGIDLESGGPIRPGSPLPFSPESPQAWLYPELLDQLGAKRGDKLRIGAQEFTIGDVVTNDPSVSGIAFTVAPKVFIPLRYLESTKLIQLGSRVTRSLLYRLPDEVDPTPVANTLRERLPNTDLRIKTHRTASEEMGRVLIYLNDYLALVALVAVFLAAVGAAYLFRSHVNKRSGDIAILRSLGQNFAQIRKLYVAQLFFLGSAAAILSTSFCLVLIPVLPKLLGSLLLPGLQLSIPASTLALALGLGTLGSILFCLPVLIQMRSLNPSALFREDSNPRIEVRWSSSLTWLPALIVYWLLAVWQSHSWLTGSLFVGLFAVSCLLLAGAGAGTLHLFRSLARARSLPLQLASINLARKPFPSLASFVALALGALLINLIPQIRKGIATELNPPESQELPSLFLFDIQDEQVDSLQKRLAQSRDRLALLSPMIRARLTHMKGVEVRADSLGNARTREQERENFMRNRSYNLSYRDGLASSEHIVNGRALSHESYDWDSEQPAEISLEVRFARRLGLKIGDTMTFDVQGVSFTGRVVNLRRVKWTSFQPNFFVQVQRGVLEDAPKTFVAATGAMTFTKKLALQRNIVSSFPNISIVDVSQTIKRILNLIDQLGIAMLFMAILTLIAGFAVLFSIANHQAEMRSTDNLLLKVLGGSFAMIRRTIIWEFSLLGVSASAAGTGVSLLVSYALAKVAFEGLWTIDPQAIAVISIGLIIVCIATGLIATQRLLYQPAIEILSRR